MPTEPINTDDCILGYTLKDRIGTGGYGEVWKVEAPGGLEKAIKLIYGFHDENRAQAELKALNRIKEVRHPFLLSLERIDIVDGRLAVITELADRCLSDRFQECLDQGLKGIPRDELLGYLKDTADALDFISEMFSLQHLDIKPANLLLLGNHVKVADFGLVKDVHDATQSMMSGLTPTYAPPELFDGRPSKSSDQYSVAIVYQEMLTGTRPFDGATAAQLASQHVNGEPDVSALPRSDQSVVLRALEKRPEARFENCRAFIEQLSKCGSKEVARKTKRTRRSTSPVRRSAAVDVTLAVPEDSLLSSGHLPTVAKLDAVEVDKQDIKIRPTIFIGVGQTATSVMRRLRRRLNDRLGNPDSIPALRILCIDTDSRDLNAAMRGEGDDQLSIDETLAVPLRRPEEYRNSAKSRLSWLSRRWIYNVPRSLQTEGIRPLGRLAFVDHHEEISRRLHDLIDSVTRPEALARTAETTELDPSEEDPQVFIVTSIAGGVGSGMVLDLAYSVRTALLERGLSDEVVHGVLAYTTGRSASEKDLTIANVVACLSEMNHYSGAAGYPGDETCELPPFDEDSPTFSDTYVVDLGSDLRQDEFDAATDRLAEYLYLNAATRSGAYFRVCRSMAPTDDTTTVRTFGLCQTANPEGDIATVPTYMLAHRLFHFWLPTAGSAQDDSSTTSSQELLVDCGLALNNILPRFETVLDSHLEPPTKKRVERAVLAAVARTNEANDENHPIRVFQQLESEIDEILHLHSHGEQPSLAGADDAESLSSVVEREYQTQVESYLNSISDIVLGALNQPGRRMKVAFESCHGIYNGLIELADKLKNLRDRTKDEMIHLARQLSSNQTAPDAPEQEPLDVAQVFKRYGQLRLRKFVLDCAIRMMSELTESIQGLQEQLRDIEWSLNDMATQLDSLVQKGQPSAADDEQGDDQLIARLLWKRITGQLAELCEAVDQKVQQGLFAEEGGFRQLIGRTHWADRVAVAVRRAARETVTAVLRGVELDQVIQSENVDDSQLAQWWQRRLELSRPPILTSCGGASHLLIALPIGGNAERTVRCVAEQFQEKPTLMYTTDGDVDVCYEVGEVPLANLAKELVRGRPDCMEYVSRLHTRTDVRWKPLLRDR